MNEVKKSLEIEFFEINDEDCLKFTFVDKFLETDAEKGVEDWKDIFNSAEDGVKLTVVWDALEMTGFDNKARIIWQKAIKKFKNQIGVVWLVTDSKTIKAGAKLMSAFTSFKIKVVKSEVDIA